MKKYVLLSNILRSEWQKPLSFSLVNPIKPPAMPGESVSFRFKQNLLCYHYIKSAKTQESIGGFYRNPLAHTSWECKYHIVFAPKYRRQIIYGKMKAEIGKILRELWERKGIEKNVVQIIYIY